MDTLIQLSTLALIAYFFFYVKTDLDAEAKKRADKKNEADKKQRYELVSALCFDC